MTPLNPFGYFEKAVVKKLWGELSPSQQRRDINGWLRVNPDATEKQARKALSDGRRGGKLFRYGTDADGDQEARTIVYQDRAKANRLKAERRKELADRNDHGPIQLGYRRPKDTPYTQDEYKHAETLALRNMKAKIGHYFKFNDGKIAKRLTKCRMEWLRWIATASEEQLVDMAEIDAAAHIAYSPLFYH